VTADRRGLDLRTILAVGTDLDMTLLDTRDATASALRAVNARCGESIDVDQFLRRLGPPMREELGRWMAPERLARALRVFRSSFLTEGLAMLAPLPGAEDLLDAVRRRNGRLVVITSRLPHIARQCLAAAGLTADTVVGSVSGREKAGAMIEHRVEIYIGDHPLDMIGATAAGVPGIGVTTGGHDAADLRGAGAVWTVPDLRAVAAAMSRGDSPEQMP
jgi:phosphoglycolate phosphatase